MQSSRCIHLTAGLNRCTPTCTANSLTRARGTCKCYAFFIHSLHPLCTHTRAPQPTASSCGGRVSVPFFQTVFWHCDSGNTRTQPYQQIASTQQVDKVTHSDTHRCVAAKFVESLAVVVSAPTLASSTDVLRCAFKPEPPVMTPASAAAAALPSAAAEDPLLEV